VFSEKIGLWVCGLGRKGLPPMWAETIQSSGNPDITPQKAKGWRNSFLQLKQSFVYAFGYKNSGSSAFGLQDLHQQFPLFVRL
jgi:hypothetical protein